MGAEVVSEPPEEPKPSNPEPGSPLPRGRHDLTPEVVERHQCDRIVAAVAQVMAEHGYGGLTVERIIALARVSRTTFYLYFPDKREAVIAAHEQIFERFLALVEEACRAQGEWTEKVRAAIGASLEFAAAEPAPAQLLVAGFLAADLTLARRVRVSYDQLAALLGEGRQIYPRAAALPAMTEQALVGAIATTLARALTSAEPEPFAGLHSQLTELTLIPYLGTEEAAKAVSGA
jgi:AcrR family transcriptional regulator